VLNFSAYQIEYTTEVGVEGVVCGLEGIHLADRCILTKLE
jgi:hypothetical protein